jgi:hypothetical protein
MIRDDLERRNTPSALSSQSRNERATRHSSFHRAPHTRSLMQQFVCRNRVFWSNSPIPDFHRRADVDEIDSRSIYRHNIGPAHAPRPIPATHASPPHARQLIHIRAPRKPPSERPDRHFFKSPTRPVRQRPVKNKPNPRVLSQIVSSYQKDTCGGNSKYQKDRLHNASEHNVPKRNKTAIRLTRLAYGSPFVHNGRSSRCCEHRAFG